MPTVGGNIDWIGVAKSCGYPNAVSVDTFEALDEALKAAKNRSELSLIEVKCSIGAREDLGRPTTTALSLSLSAIAPDIPHTPDYWQN